MVRQVSLVPIETQLGRPPEPEEVARRIAPSGPTSEQARTDVRHAYTDAIWVRYRRYADYVARQLSGADYVEVAPVEGGPMERYRRVGDGLDDAMRDIADSYAALEWTRFEREWGRAPVVTGTRAPRAAPGPRPQSPAAPAPAEERGETGGATASTGSTDAPASAPGAPHGAEKASTRGTSTAATEADDVRCRRSCSLRYRACLARCRDQPITGGGYDACAYECSDGSLSCRGACGTVAAP